MGVGSGQQWHLDRNSLEPGCTGWECGVLEFLEDPSVILLLIFIGVGVIVSVAVLREAQKAIAEEREQVTQEREAFTRFAERTKRLNPAPETGAPTSGDQQGAAAVRVAPGVVSTRSGNTGIQAVKNAYEETVMAVDHFESEYGESLEENMAAELGSDVATVVSNGGELTPGLRSALISESKRAAKRREVLLSHLEHEQQRIDSANRRLEQLEHRAANVESDLDEASGFHEGTSAWNRLDAIHSDLEQELDAQQSSLEPDSHSTDEPHLFCSYLYGNSDLSATYPVLSTLADLIDRVELNKDRAMRKLLERTHRHSGR